MRDCRNLRFDGTHHRVAAINVEHKLPVVFGNSEQSLDELIDVAAHVVELEVKASDDVGIPNAADHDRLIAD